MTTDYFQSEPDTGVIYGLFASDEPLHIRYVGQTTHAPERRLAEHLKKFGLPGRKRIWIDEVNARGAKVGIRVLGRYNISELYEAEGVWFAFWNCFCDLTNSPGDKARRWKSIQCGIEAKKGMELERKQRLDLIWSALSRQIEGTPKETWLRLAEAISHK